MALNSSGPISLAGTTAGQSIEIENGGNGTTQISLNDAAVRTLAGVPSGAITMPTNFWGKANRVTLSYTFSSNTANASLNLSSIGGYSAGKSDITVTINSGIYLYSTSTGGYGLALSGATTGDTLTIVNNGYIMGQGGNGTSQYASPSTGAQKYYAATAGGPAINVASIGISSFTVTNTSGYIGGGGGGGGGGTGDGSNPSYTCYDGGGGGAGGGTGGNGWFDAKTGAAIYSGGAGGGVGSSGSNGSDAPGGGCGPGGGGGRIMPGTGGSGGAYPSEYGRGGGAGGGGGADGSYGSGGAGGSAGNAGTSVSGYYRAGGGGGYGASGGSGNMAGFGSPGAGGGKAINLGGKSITWTGGASSSSRAYGAVS